MIQFAFLIAHGKLSLSKLCELLHLNNNNNNNKSFIILRGFFKRPGLLRFFLPQRPKGRTQSQDRGSHSGPVREMPLPTPSPTNVGLCRIGELTVPFREKCHLRMPPCGSCSRLLTHCLWRAAECRTHCSAVLFGAGESEQACSVAELHFPRG